MIESGPPYDGAPRSSHVLAQIRDIGTPVSVDKVAWVRACWEGEVAYEDGWSSHSNPYPRFVPGPPVARLFAGWLTWTIG
jgi:hypothetical protein